MKLTFKTIYIPMLLASFHAYGLTGSSGHTQQTFRTLPGSVTPQFDMPLAIESGGMIHAKPNLGGCYLGSVCPFTNSHFSYTLHDGSSASFADFSGTFQPLDLAKSQYLVTGHAVGVDSNGLAVKVKNVQIEVTIICRGGRGCIKYSHQGGFTLIR